MYRLVCVLSIALTACTSAPRPAMVAGGLAIGGGILLATSGEECVEHPHCEVPLEVFGGGVVVIAGVALLLAGIAGEAMRDDAPALPPHLATSPPAPPPANEPLVVDPAKRDTEQDRLALQASYAARRGDCTSAIASMTRLAELDASLHAKLRTEDLPIARCMPALPRQ